MEKRTLQTGLKRLAPIFGAVASCVTSFYHLYQAAKGQERGANLSKAFNDALVFIEKMGAIYYGVKVSGQGEKAEAQSIDRTLFAPV